MQQLLLQFSEYCGVTSHTLTHTNKHDTQKNLKMIEYIRYTFLRLYIAYLQRNKTRLLKLSYRYYFISLM